MYGTIVRKKRERSSFLFLLGGEHGLVKLCDSLGLIRLMGLQELLDVPRAQRRRFRERIRHQTTGPVRRDGRVPDQTSERVTRDEHTIGQGSNHERIGRQSHRARGRVGVLDQDPDPEQTSCRVALEGVDQEVDHHTLVDQRQQLDHPFAFLHPDDRDLVVHRHGAELVHEAMVLHQRYVGREPTSAMAMAVTVAAGRSHQIGDVEDDLGIAVCKVWGGVAEFLGQMAQIPGMGLDLDGPAEAV